MQNGKFEWKFVHYSYNRLQTEKQSIEIAVAAMAMAN